MSKFDLTIAFDDAEYLNPQLYMLVNTLKGNMPDGCVLHIVTNRAKDDAILKYIQQNIHTKIYHNDGKKTKHLKSRCRYMFNCFDIETDKEWVIKLEADLLILKHLDVFNEILIPEYDLVIEPENRRIFEDSFADRLWTIIYRHLGIKKPTDKIQFRENKEFGLPLYGTGIVCIQSKHLDTINKRWVSLTEKCEKWIDYNTHPNEMAFTAMSFDEGWNVYLYPPKYKFNPIGHFRKGEFPSTELIDGCKLPEDTIIFDYHRSQWLLHIAKYNKNIRNIIQRNKENIPKEWWDTGIYVFSESGS